MKFCSECAFPVTVAIPEGDNRPRYVCTNCGTIHYQNPKMVIGSIPVWEQDGELKVLLCKRAIEPRYGYWTLPAGFMENEETTGEAALRETEEEAGAQVELGKLFTLLNVAHVHQVHLFYLATLRDLDFAPGIESLDVQLFAEHEIPWDELAFPTIVTTLELFFADRARMREGEGGHGFHTRDITRRMRADDPAPEQPD
ncbi:NUDIX hydrolase [Massilia sp. 9096]|uniref:NUDIX hydrolase n=1 Tax=Massilia sp. 9096 TaxID=1500894 RepID=UPI0005608BEF|nr:NUDIX hydrolase [Massilia sp. 9096]